MYPSLDGFTITDKGNKAAKEELTLFERFLNGRHNLLGRVNPVTITEPQIKDDIPFEKLLLNRLSLLMPQLTEDNFKDVLGALKDVVSVRDKVKKVVDQQAVLIERFPNYPFSDSYTTLLNWLNRVAEDKQSVVQQNQSDALQDPVDQRASSDFSVVTVSPTVYVAPANDEKDLYPVEYLSELEDAQAFRKQYDESMVAALEFKKTLDQLDKAYYDEVIRYRFDTSLRGSIGDTKRCIPIETELSTYFASMKKADGLPLFIDTIKDAEELEILRDQLNRVIDVQGTLKYMRLPNKINVQYKKLLKLLDTTSNQLEPLRKEALKDEPSIETLVTMRDSLDPQTRRLAMSIIDKAIVKLKSIFEEKARISLA